MKGWELGKQEDKLGVSVCPRTFWNRRLLLRFGIDRAVRGLASEAEHSGLEQREKRTAGSSPGHLTSAHSQRGSLGG